MGLLGGPEGERDEMISRVGLRFGLASLLGFLIFMLVVGILTGASIGLLVVGSITVLLSGLPGVWLGVWIGRRLFASRSK